MNLELLIFIGGILHFGILLGSTMVPKVLDWKASLEKLDSLSRQLIWVHGVFIVLVIVGFGLLSILFASDLATAFWPKLSDSLRFFAFLVDSETREFVLESCSPLTGGVSSVQTRATASRTE